MPLHLLSKKSWNVYAPANIERVKRDEAEAQRQAIEQEKRALDNEANDRLDALKQRSRTSLKRKLPGEDDTDREIRLAQNNAGAPISNRQADRSPFDDTSGHFSLIPPPQKTSRSENDQGKDPYTVYLTDAGGRGQEGKSTWYTSLNSEKESWGNENPRKQAREAARLDANDPLAAMKKGVRALRETEKERKAWMQQRERDLQEVGSLARRQRRHQKKRRRRREGGHDDADSLEGFNLDEGHVESSDSQHRRKSHLDLDADSERGHRHRRSHTDRKHQREDGRSNRRPGHRPSRHHRPGDDMRREEG
jgi:hypothetical protein